MKLASLLGRSRVGLHTATQRSASSALLLSRSFTAVPVVRHASNSSHNHSGTNKACCDHHHSTTNTANATAVAAAASAAVPAGAMAASVNSIRPLYSTSAAPIETPIVWSAAAVAAAAHAGAAPKHFGSGSGSQLLRPAPITAASSVMRRAMTTVTSALRQPHRIVPPSPLSASSQAQLQQNSNNRVSSAERIPEIEPPVPESEVSPNDLSDLVANNVKWAADMVESDPLFFKRLENVNAPQYLWLGCSDSRVPANTIIGKLPGEVFVHRNVANCVVHADLNMLSVLQYAVDALRVRHVIVCGHYNCGGVMAAMSNQQYGLVDHWIRHVREVYHNHQHTIDAQPPHKRLDLLCEEHTRAQTENVCRTTIVQNAWARGQPLSVNGFIYRVSDGLLVRLVEPITCSADSRLSAKFRVVPNPGKSKEDAPDK